MDYFIFNLANRPALKEIFSDLRSQDNVILINQPYQISNKLLYWLHRIHFCYPINRRVRLPLKNIWDNYYPLKSIDFKNQHQYYLFFLDPSIINFELEYLNKLSSRNNIHMILLLFNPMEDLKRSKKFLSILKRIHFERILTACDFKDVKKYGFQYTTSVYSKKKLYENSNIDNDILFFGRAKDRYSAIIEVFVNLHQAGLKCDFSIIDAKEHENLYQDSIHYGREIPYSSILEKIQKTSCLLEVVQGIQNGITLRTFEAICYNKKLLTNNKNIVHLPFYNPMYMHVFDQIGKEEIDFIKSDMIIDYKYNGEFSPVHLLKEVTR